MAYRLILASFVAAALFVHAQPSSWNVTSRLAAIDSLVHRGTFAIDGSRFATTGDKYRYRGRYYSDKPPVLAIAGAGVALALRGAHVEIARQPKVVLVAVTLVTVAIPFALAVGTLFALLRILEIDERFAAAVAVVAGSATIALPYATVLVNHVPAAFLLIVALTCGTRFRLGGGLVWAGVAGAALALACGIDTSYVVFFALAPIALGRPNTRAYAAYVASALPFFFVLAATNVALSGNARPPDTNPSLFDWPGSPFAHGAIAGTVVHRTFPETFVYGFNVIFGTHGLLLYSPILAWAAYALVRRLRMPTREDRHRATYAFVAIASLAYVATAIVATVDYGGDAYGMRTLVGVALLACVGLGTLGETLATNRNVRIAFLATLALSLACTMLGTLDTFSSASFPLIHALSGLIAFAANHRAHGLAIVAAMIACATASFVFVAGSIERVREPSA